MSKSGWWLLPVAAVFFLAGCASSRPAASVDKTTVAVQEEQAVDGVSGYEQQDGRTGLVGRVFLKDGGQPLAGAYVNIYPDTTSNLLGPSQFISSPTDKDGYYRIDVPAGTYYIVARKRTTGEPSGPLAPGDYYSEHRRIRAEVKSGRLARVDLEVVPMKAPMFFKKNLADRRTDTGIRGRLVDASGKPVPGSFAIAYVDDNLKRLPDYASTLSDGQGRFTIYLPKGGTYYLAGRIHAWDMPHPGELYGKLGGDQPKPLAVKKGSFVEDVTLVLTPFTGTYKPGKSRRPY